MTSPDTTPASKRSEVQPTAADRLLALNVSDMCDEGRYTEASTLIARHAQQAREEGAKVADQEAFKQRLKRKQGHESGAVEAAGYIANAIRNLSPKDQTDAV